MPHELPNAPMEWAAGNDPDRLLSFQQMLEFLGIGQRLGWELAKNGRIPGIKVGRVWRFRRSALVEWIKNQEQNGGGK